MRHKCKKRKKKRKKEKGKKKRKRESFFTRRGSFLKTASNYNTFHIWFTPGSFALLPKTKTLFITLQEKLRQMQTARIWWCMASRMALLGSFYFPQSRQSDRQMRVYSVTLKKRCGNKTMMEQNTGDLKVYKTICYHFLKWCRE